MSNLNDLVKSLNQVEDIRRTECGNFKHSLPSVIASAFCATMAGCTGYRSISHFIEDNLVLLNANVGLLHGVPSPDTIRRVLTAADPQVLADIFRKWAGIDKLDPKYLQTDGKSVRASKEDGEKTVHIVTVYASDFAASLLEEQVFDKENEISAFERILLANKINFNGKCVTGDAMFCQKSFCTAITQSGGDWIFVLKKNHPNLFADVQEYFDGTKGLETNVVHISDRGRQVTKTIRFTTDVDWILKDYAFTGLSSMAEVTTEVLEKGKRTTSKQYLIGSVKTLEELFISRTKHWSIESMHWILDMAFDEDHCLCRKGNSPLNLNIFRKITHFLFSLAKREKLYKGHSDKDLTRRCMTSFTHIRNIFSYA